MKTQAFRRTIVWTTALALTACGGGTGENRVVSTPPPPAPAACSTCIVKIFAEPTTGEYSSVGVTQQASGLSTADADVPHIRYTSAGAYEIKMPGADWDRLIVAKGTIPADPNNWNLFQPESAPQNASYFAIQQSRHDGYRYSELATWGSSSGTGAVAFGIPTPAAGVPLSGSATYSGIVTGKSDVTSFNSFDGKYNVPVAGTVNLAFDFSKGSLAGTITLRFADYDPAPIGSFSFKDTVFGAGSTAYSGRFDTDVVGQNYFLGRFTGPNAEETIGAWALPFIFTTGSKTLQPDNKPHQAFGAWIAKRGP